MADITMCLNEECKLRSTCYRAQALPNEYWQSYSKFKLDEHGICGYYWECSNSTKATIMKCDMNDFEDAVEKAAINFINDQHIRHCSDGRLDEGCDRCICADVLRDFFTYLNIGFNPRNECNWEQEC